MITNIDFMILNSLQTLRSPALDWIMAALTYIGSTGLLWIVPGLVLFCRRRTRKSGAVILGAMLLGQLLGTMILKNIVMRPRPFAFPQALMTADTLVIPPPMGRWSFPSSHTVTAFAGGAGIFLIHKKWGVVALITAALIGVSRLYLYVHFPTDVLAGAALGAVCALLVELIMKKIPAFNKTDAKTA